MRAFLIALALSGCWSCGRGYSEGERTGVVNKLSHKGLIFKSWEGEMLLGGLRVGQDKDGNSTASANLWAFTIYDSRLVKVVSEAQQNGTPVVAHYVQWFEGGPTVSSDYELISIEPVKR